MLLKRFRKMQIIFSSILFICIFCFFWQTTNFDIRWIQLSHWGVNNPYAWLWNSLLVLLSFSMLFNIMGYINSHSRLAFKKYYRIGFSVVCFSLFLTGMIPMDNRILHDFVAFFYFFSFPLAIFFLAYFNSNNLIFFEWQNHLLFAALLVLIPLIGVYLFNGMAIAEISHSLLILGWNIFITVEK
jgi:hypothetical protein